MVADVRTQNRFVVYGRSMAVLVTGVALVVMAGTTSASAQIVEVRPGSTEFDLPVPVTLPSGTAALSGVVVDARTGDPVAAAVVRLGRAGTQGSIKGVVCDSQGRFVFTELPASTTYTLSALGHGYGDGLYAGEGRTDGPPRRPIEVALAHKEWRQGLTIRVWRFPEISGLVADEFGEPLVGVAVRAFSKTVVHAKAYLAGSALAVTDDRGAYRLSGLRPDSYVVAVVGSQATVPASIPEVPQRRAIGELTIGGRTVDEGNRVVSGPSIVSVGSHRLVINPLLLEAPARDRPGRSYQPVFYPSEPNAELAQAVSVDYGEGRAGVDFHLRLVTTFRITGRVPPGLRSESLPLLRLLPRGFEELGLGNEVATAVVDSDGSFTFLGVPSGQYTLVAQTVGLEFVTQQISARVPDPAGFSAGPVSGGTFPRFPNLSMLERTATPSSFWGRLPVDVAGSDVTNVMLPLQPTVSIRGRVELEDGAVLPVSQRFIHVTAEPANGDPSKGRLNTSAGRGLPGDSFSLDGLLPGTYILAGSYFPVRSVMWRGRDVTDVGIDATAGTDVDDVVITLTAAETELTGTVTNARLGQQPATVVVFPVDPALWSKYGWMPRRLRSVLVGGDGTYAFRNLPGGEYFVVAVDAALADAWVDQAFLKVASAQATRVTLEWGDRVTQDVPLRALPVK